MKVNQCKRYVFCALFAALIAISNFFIVPIGVVPIVLKNLFVVLAGTVLGSFYGGIALLIFIAAGLIGVPVFVIPGGLGVFATPLAGYIIGYFVGSLVAGLVAGLPSVSEKKLRLVPVIRVCIGSLLGFMLILFCGAVYIMRLNSMTLDAAVAAGIVPFLIGDFVKFLISVPLALSLRPIAARYIGTRDDKGKGKRDKGQGTGNTHTKGVERGRLVRKLILLLTKKRQQTTTPCPLSLVPCPQLITLNNITKHFPIYDNLTRNEQIRNNLFYALENVSLTIQDGDFTIIAGANGSGKSLLMSIIAGLEEPSSGTVKTEGKVGLVFQESDAQILGETPREDIAFGPRNMGLSKTEIARRVQSALEETGLTERADFPARSLSGGEKRRLAVAGVLAMDAEIIIFDEPYANMDFPGVVQVNQLIQKLIRDGKTLIILTHELEKCLAFANHFIVLYKGKKVFDGNIDDTLNCELEMWGIHNPLGNRGWGSRDEK